MKKQIWLFITLLPCFIYGQGIPLYMIENAPSSDHIIQMAADSVGGAWVHKDSLGLQIDSVTTTGDTISIYSGGGIFKVADNKLIDGVALPDFGFPTQYYIKFKDRNDLIYDTPSVNLGSFELSYDDASNQWNFSRFNSTSVFNWDDRKTQSYVINDTLTIIQPLSSRSSEGFTGLDTLTFVGGGATDTLLIRNIVSDSIAAIDTNDVTGLLDFVTNNSSGGSADGVVSDMQLVGTDLTVTGSNGGFNGTVDLSSLSGSATDTALIRSIVSDSVLWSTNVDGDAYINEAVGIFNTDPFYPLQVGKNPAFSAGSSIAIIGDGANGMVIKESTASNPYSAAFFGPVKFWNGSEGGGALINANDDAGTAGQVLTSQGEASTFTWETIDTNTVVGLGPFVSNNAPSQLWTESGANVYRSSGNVGIGTTNPTTPLYVLGTSLLNGRTIMLDWLDLRSYLEVDGTITVKEPSTGNILTASANNITRTTIDYRGQQSWNISSGSAEVGKIGYATPAGYPGIVLWTGASYDLNRFDIVNRANHFTLGYSTNTDAIGIYQTGNVGIDKSNPLAKLHIGGDLRIDDYTGGTPTGLLAKDATGQIVDADANLIANTQLWTESGADVYRSSGNVGIGTATPSADLDLIGNAEINGNATITDSLNVIGSIRVHSSLYDVNNSKGSDGQLALNAEIPGSSDGFVWTDQDQALVSTHYATLYDASATLSSVGTSYTVVNFDDAVAIQHGSSADANAANERIDIDRTGWYEVDYNISFSTNTSAEFQIAVIDGSGAVICGLQNDYVNSSNDFGNVSTSNIANLLDTDNLRLAIKTSSGTANLADINATLKIRRIR